jgi:type IV pilus assembly protein PilB
VEASRVELAGGAFARPRLGELLLREERLSPEELAAALLERERSGRRLGQILVELGYVTSRELAKLLAEQSGLDFLDLEEAEIDPSVAKLLPEKYARRYGALPVKLLDDDLVLVAVADPTNVVTSDDLRMALGMGVRFAVVDEIELEPRISRFYRIEAHLESDAEVENEDSAEGNPESTVAVRLVNELIAVAVDSSASDLHFEPQTNGMVVRARIDGLTRRIGSVPKSDQASLVSRLKIIGELDIAERRLPQDGRASVRVGPRKLDLRMAVLPTPAGEKVILRIHHRAEGRLELEQLGMSPDARGTFTRAVSQPFGAVIVCGPTGSGKTTTLYTALDLLNDEGRVLTTIEDPVEHQMPGVSQVEVNPRSGLSFARGLRTILRADPDVLLVGEVRDEETAKIAMQASLTGHLVLTTLHSQSAPSAVARLKDMSVDPGLISAAVNLIVAQRLARRLCLRCRRAAAALPEELEELGLEGGDEVLLYSANGCEECAGTGYKGRVALYEMMPIAGSVLSSLDARTEVIHAAAVAEGMTTLRQDGCRVCLDGVTTLDEVRRVAGDRPF